MATVSTAIYGLFICFQVYTSVWVQIRVHGLYIYLMAFLPKNTEVKTVLSYSPLSRRMGRQQGDMATWWNFSLLFMCWFTNCWNDIAKLQIEYDVFIIFLCRILFYFLPEEVGVHFLLFQLINWRKWKIILTSNLKNLREESFPWQN